MVATMAILEKMVRVGCGLSTIHCQRKSVWWVGRWDGWLVGFGWVGRDHDRCYEKIVMLRWYGYGYGGGGLMIIYIIVESIE